MRSIHPTPKSYKGIRSQMLCEKENLKESYTIRHRRTCVIRACTQKTTAFFCYYEPPSPTYVFFMQKYGIFNPLLPGKDGRILWTAT